MRRNFDRYRYLVKAVQQYIMDSFPYWHRSRGRCDTRPCLSCDRAC